ncbi:FG-GAP-like repeat-containing protein [Actinacidiphila glaucinigra]|uniref:FG-GAP-like repeat-containing protein n=1 Tax=Actinacidiphila glaucinigra TaxID=235986 RepID=UPI0033C93AE3
MKLEARGAEREGVDKQQTQRFSGLMLTWKGGRAPLDGTAEARARSLETGEWSGWKQLVAELAPDGVEGKRAGVLGGTEVLWTGASDAVEVRVAASDGTTTAGLPKGIELKLIDPGTTPREAQQPAAFAVDETTPAATPTDTATPTDSTSPSESVTPTATDTATETVSPTATAPSGSASASPTDTVSPSPTKTVPTAPKSSVVKPPIIAQAQWGASTAYNGTPEYDTEVKAVVVHHSGVDVDNETSCVHSAERVRTIQQGHLAKGWYDIGYHFLVDRCGQIFEGRSGGMDLPVHGAHDYGFNTDTIGISFLANTETVKPTRAALDAIARVAAWRLGQYGANPAGTVTLTSAGDKGVDGNLIAKGTAITLPRIFGHRDTNATACPGKNLYAKLPLIRSLAASPGISHALPTSDFNRDGVTDLVAGTPKAASSAGALIVVPGGENGPVAAKRRTINQNSAGVPGSSESGDGFGTATAWGDVNGDGYADVAVGSPGENDTSGNADRGSVTVLYGPGLNSGFSYTTTGVTAAGAKLGSAVAVGDFNADGKSDVFSAGTGKGGNWNARQTGGATKYGTLTTASGAIAYADAASGDFNRDGYADVALNYRDSTGIGRVTWFKGSSTGLVKVSTLSVRGGRSIAAGDVNGNGYDDIVIGQPYSESSAYKGGQVTMVPGTSTGFTTTGMKTITQDTTGVPGTPVTGDAMGSSVSVGDYNLDGYADVLTGLPGKDITRSGVSRTDAGSVLLLRGSSTGLTGSSALSYSQDTSGIAGDTESGDHFGSAVVLQDLSGWGRADFAIGVEGEDSGDGTILQLDSGSAGISTSGGVYYGRSQLGTPAGVRLGQTLAP